jgi:hypothetical protein
MCENEGFCLGFSIKNGVMEEKKKKTYERRKRKTKERQTHKSKGKYEIFAECGEEKRLF